MASQIDTIWPAFETIIGDLNLPAQVTLFARLAEDVIDLDHFSARQNVKGATPGTADQLVRSILTALRAWAAEGSFPDAPEIELTDRVSDGRPILGEVGPLCWKAYRSLHANGAKTPHRMFRANLVHIAELAMKALDAIDSADLRYAYAALIRSDVERILQERRGRPSKFAPIDFGPPITHLPLQGIGGPAPLGPLTVLIEPGNASAEKLGEFLAEVSKLYRLAGGAGLSFSLMDVRELEGVYA